MDTADKPAKRRNKFAGKEDISRSTTDSIITGQIDQLREISHTSNQAVGKLQESVDVLYNKQIPVDTERFEQLYRHFIDQMEHKIKKVKQPSKGLKWYIAMWIITIVSGWLGGYFIYKSQEWKKEAAYWYRLYEECKSIDK